MIPACTETLSSRSTIVVFEDALALETRNVADRLLGPPDRTAVVLGYPGPWISHAFAIRAYWVAHCKFMNSQLGIL